MKSSTPQPGIRTTLYGILVFSLLATACQQEPDSDSSDEPEVLRLPVRELSYRTPILNQTYPGRTTGLRQVDVRAQVSGVLRSRDYSEGDMVDQGDILFQIDPDRYTVEVQRAEADLASAEARERQATREWELVSSLFEEDGTTQRELDRARSDLEIARAEVEVAKASLESHLIDLNYSSVEAPIAGVAGLEELAVGNFIQEGDFLTTLTQTDPIQVHFAVPEAHLRAFGAQVRGPGIDVFITLADGRQYPMPGRLDFVGSTVDEQTGSVSFRAVFPNPDRDIIPGQFVRITLGQLMLERVLSVPRSALGRDAEGPLLYVLNEDNEVEERSVQLGMEFEDEVAIYEGVGEGDRVVLSGLPALSPGRKVNPQAEGEENDDQQDGDEAADREDV